MAKEALSTRYSCTAAGSVRRRQVDRRRYIAVRRSTFTPNDGRWPVRAARTACLREHGPSRLADDQHARPSRAAEAASRLGCTVWLVDSSGWHQLSRRTIVTAAHRCGADASLLTVACLRPAPIAFVVGLGRLGDGPACCRANLVESMCARFMSVSSTECVMVVVEVGAHAPTSHPSQSPLGIKTNLLAERELGRSVF